MNSATSTFSFHYSGKKYFFTASIFVNSEKNFGAHALDNNYIQMFDYVIEANTMYVTGSLVYEDRQGIIDKYIAKQFPYLNVMFSQIDEKQVGTITTDNFDQTSSFNHVFFIKSIEILNRKDHYIVYKLHLVDVNWLLCQGSITYSNYGRNPESIIDIIKAMIAYNKLNIDANTFEKVKTNVKINYITQSNDNTITTIKYLLSKLYYYHNKDSAIKFLFYNSLKDTFGIFDLSNSQTSTSQTSILVSLFNSNQEVLVQNDQINFGSIIRQPKTKSFRNIFNYKVNDYDYKFNKINDSTIKSEDIISFQNMHFPIDEHKDKYENIFNTTLKYNQSCAYWNNDNLEYIYNNVLKTFFEDNAFTIATNGQIGMKPSDFINITLDRDLQYINSQKHMDIDKVKKQYKSFEGQWIVSKVHNYVFLNATKYQQVLTLFRNFTPEDMPQ